MTNQSQVSVPCPGERPHLLHVFPSFEIGGVQLRAVRIMNHLGRRYRNTVISLDGVTAAAEQIAVSTPAEVRAVAVDKRRPFKSFLDFRRVLADLRPDLLGTYNWGAIEWAAANRLWPICPHIHFESGFGRDEARRQYRRRVIARRLLLSNAQAVVVPSRTLEHIALNVWRLAPQQLRYIPDGIHAARFYRSERLRSASEPRRKDIITIGTVAALRAEKNVGRLIEVFAQIADDRRLRLVIVGDGPERMRLENLAAARRLDDRITFLGHLPRPEEILPSFDIFGLSSDTEQIPNAVLEAMAAELPIAAVDVGDIRAMVAPSNLPYIVPAGRFDFFALALRQLAEDAALRDSIGAENRDRVQRHFDQERMFRDYDALLLEVLKVRPGRRS